jgi:CHAT domain-containing protein
MQGLIETLQGDLTDSQDQLDSARASFKRAHDAETEVRVLVKRAENLSLLGDARGAWRDRLQALALIGRVRSPRLRYGILGEALATCLDERLPRPALHFGTSALHIGSSWSSWAMSDTFTRQAAIHHSLGADDLAVAAMIQSRRWITRIPDESQAESQEAEANAVEGQILIRENPEQASRYLKQSLVYFQGTVPVRVPALHVLLARAQLARGDEDAAESELLAGIEAMERGRISLRDADQVSFFDQALPLFDDMVRFQVSRRQDFDRALAFVERSRARQLVDSLAGAGVGPLDPDALRRQLPDGLALVYYVSLDDRLFAWVLDRDGSHFIERPLRAADLSRLVAANRAAIEGRAPEELVRRSAAKLHDELVRPLLPFIASQRALVVIAGGSLQSVAFASLWDRQSGHYLVEDYLLGVAASGTTFVRTSASAATPFGASPQALVVGNPQIDRRLWVGMPNLPGAEAEAVEIAALYPRSELLSGAAATKTAFLERARNSQVVHFAGHAAASADAPSAARLLFARNPATGDSGALYLHELGRPGLPRTRVVVLGACRTAAGAVSRVEGAMSLGRPFLAAGVPDVVASLWDIDDDVSRQFFLGFHRALLVGGDPLLALRTAQLAFLHGDDPSLAHPSSWAPFICMGGIGPHSLSKGEAS